MTNYWTVLRQDDASQDYRWLAEHPDHGEWFFRTKREALAFVRSRTR